MIFVFYFFAALLVFLSFKSFRGGIAYLKFFRDELAKPPSDFTPFATIIAPCRGVDDGMRENFQALLDQDYPDFEVIFVVDDPADSAVSVIDDVLNCGDAEMQRKDFFSSASQRLCGKNSVRTNLVVADKAENSSQKVANLREAVLHADERSRVFAFVDSDTRPSEGWLRTLVAPLENGRVGATTGYRWFISRNSTFASEMRSAWNASIASALGPNVQSNFCWGGSMAMRRDVFERVDMREKWHGTLSDDFAVTRTMNEAKLPIVFVPQALTASVEDCTWREMLEFTTRQMKITRVYAPKLWLLSFFGSGLFSLVMIIAFLIAIFARTNGFTVWFSIATILMVAVFSTGKSWLRLRAVQLVLIQYSAELRRQFWTQNTLWTLSPALFFYNAFAALISRRMTWRGTRYELKSRGETVIIADKI